MSDDDEIDRPRRARRGPRDGNDRIARISRWLDDVPSSDAVNELVLFVTASGEEEVAQRWTKARVRNGALAMAINDLIQDAADDAGTTTSATLAWLTADGDRYLSKNFRAVPKDENLEVVRPLDGSQTASLAASQRHVEALVQSQLELVARFVERDNRADRYLAGLFDALDRGNQALAARLAHIETAYDQARQDRYDAQDLASEAIAKAEEAERAAEETEREDQIGKVVEVFAKSLTQGPSNDNGRVRRKAN